MSINFGKTILLHEIMPGIHTNSIAEVIFSHLKNLKTAAKLVRKFEIAKIMVLMHSCCIFGALNPRWRMTKMP